MISVHVVLGCSCKRIIRRELLARKARRVIPRRFERARGQFFVSPFVSCWPSHNRVCSFQICLVKNEWMCHRWGSSWWSKKKLNDQLKRYVFMTLTRAISGNLQCYSEVVVFASSTITGCSPDCTIFFSSYKFLLLDMCFRGKVTQISPHATLHLYSLLLH